MHFQIRGLAALLQFRGMNFFPGEEGGDGGAGAGAGAGGAGGGDGAAGAAGAGAGSGEAGAGNAGGAGAGEGGGTGSAGAAASPGIEEIRRSYQETKGQLDKWTKLGTDPDQIAGHAGVGQKLYQQYEGIATRLGYKADEFKEAFASDPGKVIAFLGRKSAEKAQQERANGDKPLTREQLDQILEEKPNAKTAPLEARENERLAQEADFKVTQHFEKLGQQTFTPEGWKAMPAGEREVLQLVTQEMMAYDEAALVEIKTKGSMAPVQRYFQEAVKFLDGYYNARLSRETGGRAAAAGAGAGKGNGNGAGKGGAAIPPGVNPETNKPWTINELIEEPSRIGAAYK